jgi:hypothetical protein
MAKASTVALFHCLNLESAASSRPISMPGYVRAVERLIEQRVQIIAPACGLSMQTRPENLKALTDTVKNM